MDVASDRQHYHTSIDDQCAGIIALLDHVTSLKVVVHSGSLQHLPKTTTELRHLKQSITYLALHASDPSVISDCVLSLSGTLRSLEINLLGARFSSNDWNRILELPQLESLYLISLDTSNLVDSSSPGTELLRRKPPNLRHLHLDEVKGPSDRLTRAVAESLESLSLHHMDVSSHFGSPFSNPPPQWDFPRLRQLHAIPRPDDWFNEAFFAWRNIRLPQIESLSTRGRADLYVHLLTLAADLPTLKELTFEPEDQWGETGDPFGTRAAHAFKFAMRRLYPQVTVTVDLDDLDDLGG